MPGDAVLAFTLCANVAAQDATGDPASSVSAAHVLTRLKGSPESRALLFAVSAASFGPQLADAAGYPLLPSYYLTAEDSGAVAPPDYCGFIHLTVPLLEERDAIEVECVLGLGYQPLPGQSFTPDEQAVAEWMVDTALDLARKLGRQRVQVGLLHAPGVELNADPFAQLYRSRGFQLKHREEHMVMPMPTPPPAALLSPRYRVEVWRDYAGLVGRDSDSPLLDQVLCLLEVASADADNGQLTVEIPRWTRERLDRARRQLADRRAHTILAAIIDHHPKSTPGGSERVASLAELSFQADGDPEVAEWTLTVTARDYRRRGLAWAAQLAALNQAADFQARLRRIYTTLSPADTAMTTLAQRLGAHTLCTATAWETTLPPAPEDTELTQHL